MLLLGRGAPAWQAATCVPTRGTCSGCCSRFARRASRRRSPGVTLTRVLPAGSAETPDGQLWVRPEAWCVIRVRGHGRAAAPRLPAERRLVGEVAGTGVYGRRGGGAISGRSAVEGVRTRGRPPSRVKRTY